MDENDEKDRVETASGPSPFCLAATLWERAHLEYSMNLKRKGGLQTVSVTVRLQLLRPGLFTAFDYPGNLQILNPLSPKSDQNQIFPHNINIQARVKVIRVNKMITKGKLL